MTLTNNPRDCAYCGAPATVKDHDIARGPVLKALRAAVLNHWGTRWNLQILPWSIGPL